MSDPSLPPTDNQQTTSVQPASTPAKPDTFGNPWVLVPAALIALACLCLVGVASLAGAGWALRAAQPVALSTLSQISLSTPSPAPHTATPTLASAQATATAVATWPLLLSEPFDSNTNNWLTQSSTTTDGTYKISLAGGKYRWEVEAQTQEFFSPGLPDFPPVSDFSTSVEFDQLQGSDLAVAGIIFRAGNDGFYCFTLNQQGLFRFFLNYKGQLTNSQSWQEPKVKLNAHNNKLAVSAVGSHFIFFLNDQIVGEADDTRLTNGWVGLAMGAPVSTQTAIVEFDNFEVHTPAYDASVAPAATAGAQLLATQANLPTFLQDDFTSNDHGWTTGNDDNDYVSIRQSLTAGKYDWQLKAHKGVFWSEIPKDLAPDNFYYTVDVQKAKGPSDSDYGVIFRNHGSDLYYFAIDDNRVASVSLRSGSQWSALLTKYNVQAIQPGEVNRLGVIAQGSHFTFYINDQYLGEMDDTHLSFGYAGLAMELQNPDDLGEFLFSNYQLRNLKSVATTPVQIVTHTPVPSATP